LWSYDGTIAHRGSAAALGRRAVELLHDLAAGIWADPLVAYDHAAGFAALDTPPTCSRCLGAACPPAGACPAGIAISGEHPLLLAAARAGVGVCIGILQPAA